MSPEERQEVADVVGEVVAERIEPLADDIQRLKDKVYLGNGQPSLLSKVAELQAWAKLVTAIVFALISLVAGVVTALLP